MENEVAVCMGLDSLSRSSGSQKSRYVFARSCHAASSFNLGPRRVDGFARSSPKNY